VHISSTNQAFTTSVPSTIRSTLRLPPPRMGAMDIAFNKVSSFFFFSFAFTFFITWVSPYPSLSLSRCCVGRKLDGSKCRIGVIRSRWNSAIIDSLTSGVKTALKDCGVLDKNVYVTEVPGAYELPQAAQYLAESGTVDAVVCVGCLIKGDTGHFHYISSAVSHGIMEVSVKSSLPVVFGVLTVNNEEQAKARAFGENNHGLSWGKVGGWILVEKIMLCSLLFALSLSLSQFHTQHFFF
jgi:6,7-dimethyl-8-ribityllumazine synthase